MVNLLYTEFLKVKGAKMILISTIGATVTPLMCFLAYLGMKSKKPDEIIRFDEYFSQTSMYIVLLIGVLLYGVITAYIFEREYIENTLKTILTIPVSRTNFILSKFIILFIWIMALTFIAFILTFIFGLIGQFEGLSSTVLVDALKQYFIGGSLLFLLTSPVVFVAVLFKNFVPTIVFTICITMVSILIANSEYRVLYPWSAVETIAKKMFLPEYPPEYSYISIFVTSIIGFVATMIYFKKVDIN